MSLGLFHGLRCDLASKCAKRFHGSLCAAQSLNCTFKHSVIFVINIMVSEGREACTMLITNWSSRSRNSRLRLLGPNAVFMKDFKAPPWALCSELSLAFDNIKNFYNM